MQKWYIIMAKSGQEHSSMSLLGQAGIETYYPEVKECFNDGGRRRFRLSGLFPGYFSRVSTMSGSIGLFVILEVSDKVVAFGQIPAEVDPSLLREIQEGIRKRDVVQVPSFRPGDVVRINSGPFAGIKAVFESAMPRKERAVVLLHVLSWHSRAVVQVSNIEELSEAV